MDRRRIAARLAPAWMVAALAVAGAASAAQDVQWTVTGTFIDGGTLSGVFDVDKAGVLFDWDIVTTAGSNGAFAGEEYKNGLSGATSNNQDAAIEVGFHFNNVLKLSFLDSLFTPEANDALVVTGSPVPSFECVNSFSCGDGTSGTNRVLVSGSALAKGTTISGAGGGSTGGVPEPATWALAIAGFGLAGVALRRRKAPAAA